MRNPAGSFAVRVTHLYRYPVKSMAGEALESTKVEYGGLAFDRLYAFIDHTPHRDGKKLTARQAPRMLGLRASARDGKVSVIGAAGTAFRVGQDLTEFVAATLRRPVSLVTRRDGESLQDAHDVLVINAASLRALQDEWSKPLEVVRFRPNIVLDGPDATAYEEEGWIGRSFGVGGACLTVVEANVRCGIPTLDPRTLQPDPSLLKLLVERHRQCFGVYCRVTRPGGVALGDEWVPRP
jgi:uncharacterized protein YcbX